jgi:hypothetical protein
MGAPMVTVRVPQRFARELHGLLERVISYWRRVIFLGDVCWDEGSDLKAFVDELGEVSNQPFKRLVMASNDLDNSYYVWDQGDVWFCTCPHYTHRLQGTGQTCKHIDAVRKGEEA